MYVELEAAFGAITEVGIIFIIMVTIVRILVFLKTCWVTRADIHCDNDEILALNIYMHISLIRSIILLKKSGKMKFYILIFKYTV